MTAEPNHFKFCDESGVEGRGVVVDDRAAIQRAARRVDARLLAERGGEGRPVGGLHARQREILRLRIQPLDGDSRLRSSARIGRLVERQLHAGAVACGGRGRTRLILRLYGGAVLGKFVGRITRDLREARPVPRRPATQRGMDIRVVKTKTVTLARTDGSLIMGLDNLPTRWVICFSRSRAASRWLSAVAAAARRACSTAVASGRIAFRAASVSGISSALLAR